MNNSHDRLSPRMWIVITLIAALIGAASHLVAALIASSLPPRPTVPGDFGEWEAKSAETIYRARNDGFVLVNSSGNHGGTGVRIEVNSELCARIQRPYRTAICPVPRDAVWEVETQQNADVEIKWLPIVERVNEP